MREVADVSAARLMCILGMSAVCGGCATLSGDPGLSCDEVKELRHFALNDFIPWRGNQRRNTYDGNLRFESTHTLTGFDRCTITEIVGATENSDGYRDRSSYSCDLNVGDGGYALAKELFAQISECARGASTDRVHDTDGTSFFLELGDAGTPKRVRYTVGWLKEDDRDMRRQGIRGSVYVRVKASSLD